MIKIKVHERALHSSFEELLMGNEATMKILHFLVMNTSPYLAQTIRFLGFKVL